MSGRKVKKEEYDEDVESFRRRKRQADRRRHRDEDDEEEGRALKEEGEEENGGNHRHPSSSASADYALERERRMARLRQELKDEDEDMAALDETHGAEEAGRQSQRLKPQETIIQVNEEELEGLDEEEQLRRLMGIEGFGSTKGQKVEDNQNSAARGVAAKNKARKYRQYMNRKNGFNRPLEKMD